MLLSLFFLVLLSLSRFEPQMTLFHSLWFETLLRIILKKHSLN